MMNACPNFRMLGLLVFLIAAYMPKVTIAPVIPQSAEKLAETLQSADSAPGRSGTPSTRLTNYSSSEQHVARPDKDQSKGKGKNPMTQTHDDTKGHGRIPVSKPERERTKLQKKFDKNRELLTEMERQYESLKNELERLRGFFIRYDKETRSYVGTLIAFPQEHFPRLFTARLAELGGIGQYIAELGSKPMTVSMPEAANPRSNQVENIAQVPELHEATEVRTLSGDALQIVKEATNIAIVLELRGLFRRIVPEHAGPELEQFALLKQTYYEKMIFQVLNYMFKFKLISLVEMKSFFERPGTLELTWLHLSRVFQKDLNGIRGYHAFIPQINFIVKEWKLDHLGDCLAELNKNQKSYIVYKALQWTIENLDDGKKAPLNRTPESASITEFFCKEEVFRSFWSLEPSSSEFDPHHSRLIRENISKSMQLFQKFPEDSPQREVTKETKQIEFLVNFHILHFFKTYGNRQVQLIMQNRPSPMFTEEFELIAFGFEIYQRLKTKYDYHYFFMYPDYFQKYIPSSVTKAKEEKLEIELTRLKDEYYEETMKFFHLRSALGVSDNWIGQVPVKEIFETLITFGFHGNYPVNVNNVNMWLFDTAPHVTSHLLQKMTAYEFLKKLRDHLLRYFDYNFWDFDRLPPQINEDNYLLLKAMYHEFRSESKTQTH